MHGLQLVTAGRSYHRVALPISIDCLVHFDGSLSLQALGEEQMCPFCTRHLREQVTGSGGGIDNSFLS